MKPKKPDRLDADLKRSLKHPAPAPAKPETPPPPPRLTATISLHGEEQEKAARILEILLRSRRKGGGLSDAVKVALQLCPLDPEKIMAAWKRSHAQDGRSRRYR